MILSPCTCMYLSNIKIKSNTTILVMCKYLDNAASGGDSLVFNCNRNLSNSTCKCIQVIYVKLKLDLTNVIARHGSNSLTTLSLKDTSNDVEINCESCSGCYTESLP